MLVLHIQDLWSGSALSLRVLRPVLLARLEFITFVIGLVGLPDQLHQLFYPEILAWVDSWSTVSFMMILKFLGTLYLIFGSLILFLEISHVERSGCFTTWVTFCQTTCIIRSIWPIRGTLSVLKILSSCRRIHAILVVPYQGLVHLTLVLVQQFC